MLEKDVDPHPHLEAEGEVVVEGGEEEGTGEEEGMEGVCTKEEGKEVERGVVDILEDLLPETGEMIGDKEGKDL